MDARISSIALRSLYIEYEANNPSDDIQHKSVKYLFIIRSIIHTHIFFKKNTIGRHNAPAGPRASLLPGREQRVVVVDRLSNLTTRSPSSSQSARERKEPPSSQSAAADKTDCRGSMFRADGSGCAHAYSGSSPHPVPGTATMGLRESVGD